MIERTRPPEHGTEREILLLRESIDGSRGQ